MVALPPTVLETGTDGRQSPLDPAMQEHTSLLPPPTAPPAPPSTRRRMLWILGSIAILGKCATLYVLARNAPFLQPSWRYFDDTRQPSATASIPSHSPYKSTLAQGSKGMVSSEHPICSQIGADILKQNGSAVDACIASALCIGTVHSFSSGIGGGGFMLVRNATNQSELIDFREQAPGAATADMYLKDINLAQVGGLAVAVPGEIRGMEAAHRKYGKLPWAKLFQPSIDLARQGFIVDQILEFVVQFLGEMVWREPEFRRVFTIWDSERQMQRLVRSGDRVIRPRYANTLETIARNGPDAFYHGPLARAMVKAARARGGIITEQDFAAYQAEHRDTLVSTYRHFRVITAPPPTSGPILALVLNILEGYELPQEGNRALNYHRLIEAFKFGYARRTILADPKFVDIDAHVNEFLTKPFAAAIRANISDTQTFDVGYYNPDFDIQEPHGTTHISVLEASTGQAVSMTSTVNLPFGAQIMDPVTGIVLNDEMDDFSTHNKSNAFGLRPSPNNKVVAGKRPLSSSVPVILEHDGHVQLVAGASGGSRIISAVVQTILNALDYRMDLSQAIDYSRLHHQLLPNEIRVEDGFSAVVLQDLKAKGHQLTPVLLFESCVQAVYNTLNGTLHGVSDNRKHGLAVGV
ncbi:hypothetical protein H4R34_002467 [Dimargaris verticillata]|uniref:Glutathione hydrolase n=1 Tax=Dimargaris verticillata TaxID=2761393 RepID=A0A9W8B443_9FUNG|nr:hypothetical protein H4R34_002467 [Dimargaris verticillata]